MLIYQEFFQMWNFCLYFEKALRKINDYDWYYFLTEILRLNKNQIDQIQDDNQHISQIVYGIMKDKNNFQIQLKISSFFGNCFSVFYNDKMQRNQEIQILFRKSYEIQIRFDKDYFEQNILQIQPQEQFFQAKQNRKIICICQSSIFKGKTWICQFCTKIFHSKCFPLDQEKFICPECILNYYGVFHDRIYFVFEPQNLINEKYYEFFISVEQNQANHYLIIKSLLIEDKIINYTDFFIHFPAKCEVYINQKLVKKFTIFKDQKPNEDRTDELIEIPLGFNLQIIKTGFNYLQIWWELEWETFIGNEYYFSIEISKKLTIQKIIQKEIQKSLKNKGEFIDIYFQQSKDIDQVKIKLQDPLTLEMIVYPCRGSQCEHINTFCLRNLLRNLLKRDFKRVVCPICQKIIF